MNQTTVAIVCLLASGFSNVALLNGQRVAADLQVEFENKTVLQVEKMVLMQRVICIVASLDPFSLSKTQSEELDKAFDELWRDVESRIAKFRDPATPKSPNSAERLFVQVQSLRGQFTRTVHRVIPAEQHEKLKRAAYNFYPHFGVSLFDLLALPEVSSELGLTERDIAMLSTQDERIEKERKARNTQMEFLLRNRIAAKLSDRQRKLLPSVLRDRLRRFSLELIQGDGVRQSLQLTNAQCEGIKTHLTNYCEAKKSVTGSWEDLASESDCITLQFHQLIESELSPEQATRLVQIAIAQRFADEKGSLELICPNVVAALGISPEQLCRISARREELERQISEQYQVTETAAEKALLKYVSSEQRLLIESWLSND